MSVDMRRLGEVISGHWQLLGLTAAIFLLWPTDLVLPLKILIVFLHEMSHALALLLTGGSVESLTVDRMQGGLVTGYGGNRFITLSAGYLGSLLLGMALMILAVRTTWDRAILGGFGALILLTTALYARGLFALLFGGLTGAVMIAVAIYLNRSVSDLCLRVIGLSSMIYVPFDIFSDTISRSHLRSDARMLAEEFGGSTTIWGTIWLVLSLLALWLCVRYGLGGDSNIRRHKPPGPKRHST
ncbi:MAG: M50 family metallopeptidase [Pseudomonadota bacterium]